MNRKTFVAALLVLGAGLAPAQLVAQTEPDPFMTGADPIDPSEYDALPKLAKFRAWLPSKVDLSQNFPQPSSQGMQPNCVAWATTYAARSFLVGRELGKQPTAASEQMSPAYVYNRLRKPGSLCNKAIRIVDALNFLEREGSVTLADFPDDISKCPIPAPLTLKEKASAYRLGGWRAIDRESKAFGKGPVVVDDVKGAASRGEPVVFAMPVMADFKALRDGTVYHHLQPEKTNYHAMAVVGYDEERQAFRIINSWGQAWGDKGYAWVGYDTFKLLVTEAYALQDNPKQAAGLKPVVDLAPRQKLDKLVGSAPCGAVKLSNVKGRLTLSGFTGSDTALGELRSAALAVDPKADVALVKRPWPQCEAELTLASQLGVSGVSLVAKTAEGSVRPGDPVAMRAEEIFGISAEVPADKPYLSIIYLQADGSAVELYRGTPAPAGGKKQGSVTIGLEGAREAQFKVGPPFGDEMVIALASDRPLFGNEMADYGTERQFLTGLRAKLTKVPKSSVSAAVLRIRTQG